MTIKIAFTLNPTGFDLKSNKKKEKQENRMLRLQAKMQQWNGLNTALFHAAKVAACIVHRLLCTGLRSLDGCGAFEKHVPQ